LQLVGNGGAIVAVDSAVASTHHELAGFLHQADGVAHGGFRLGNRVALVFQARCSVWMRLMRVSARSAWAADTGSSLARTTRLPEVRFSAG
jgi:hypothetical protein